MVDLSITARARYLDESAHLLASTSPAISRHLNSKLHRVATDYNLSLPDAQQREACGACGNIMIAGWTSRTYVDRGRSSRSLKKSANPRTSATKSPSQKQTKGQIIKAVCYECLICSRVTRQALPAPRKAPIEKPEQVQVAKLGANASRRPSGANTTSESGLVPPLSSFPNASSRRRAKARKQSGLQALLAKKKEESLGSGFSTDFGLDLMDLMKTG